MEAPPPASAAAPRSDLKRPRLSIKEKVGFSLGDAASNLYFQTFVVFLPIFYTDVFGLSAAAMGTMLLVTRVFDAVNDPLMGMIADRTETRWGKFRPYIAAFAIPLAIAGILAFTTPGFGAAGKLAYAYATYMLLVVMYTVINVPYSALMGVTDGNSWLNGWPIAGRTSYPLLFDRHYQPKPAFEAVVEAARERE